MPRNGSTAIAQLFGGMMPWIVTVRCRNGITFELYFYSETDSRAFVAATMEAIGVLSCTVTDNAGKIAATFNK